MKTRESGMPDEEMWQTFFSPSQTLLALGLRRDMPDVAEFGCGYEPLRFLPHKSSEERYTLDVMFTRKFLI